MQTLTRYRSICGVLLIVVITLVAYWPALRGRFIWDDNLLIVKNRLVRADDGLSRMWFTTEPFDYWPLTNSTFWLEWRLWGMQPLGYHVTNVMLHIAAALLVWAILRTLAIPGAFLAALLFAVHPVNVESVAWIAQRKNTLAMLFFLLSILLYLRHIEPQPTSGNQQRMARWYWFSLLAFLLAMLSKGSVAILPLVLVLIVWWRRRRVTVADLLQIAPFILVAALLTGVNIWFQTHGGEAIRVASLSERLTGAGAIVWFYLSKALVPINLIFVYPMWQVESRAVLWWLPLLAAYLVTIVLLRQRDSFGWSRHLLFAWGVFGAALLPVLGFTDVYFMKYSLVADHYAYIALVAVVALVAAGWSLWRHHSHPLAPGTATLSAVIVAVALTFLTFQQSRLYANAVTLYQATLEKNPDCWMAHDNLGAELLRAGHAQEAMQHHLRALELRPETAEAENNLGLDLLVLGRPAEALEHCRRAARLRPNYADAYNNLGNILNQLGRPQEAIQYYLVALQLKPELAEAHNNLGYALANAGQLPEAIRHLEEAVRLQPDLAAAHRSLGFALAKANRQQEAIAQYQQAVELDPDHPDDYFKLGDLLTNTGQFSQAIAQFQRALELLPDYPEAESQLAVALLNAGRPEEALKHCQKAVELRPNFTEAYANMALAYDQLHQPAKAIDTAEKAIDLARSQGQSDEAKQIEAWLKNYRLQQGQSQNAESNPSTHSPP